MFVFNLKGLNDKNKNEYRSTHNRSNKEYRRLPPVFWVNLINRSKFSGTFIVIDDGGISGDVISKLSKKKVILIRKLNSLWDGLYLSKHARLLMGADGGGFNFLQIPTNAIEFIMYTDPEVWKPFSKNKYHIVGHNGKFTIIRSKTSDGLTKLVIYKKSLLKSFNERLLHRDPIVIKEYINLSFNWIPRVVDNFLDKLFNI